MLRKSYGIQVDSSNRSRLPREKILRKARKNACEAITLQRLGVLRQNLVCVLTSMTWDFLQCFDAAPPSGQEIWKMHIFAYNFWMVWPKITKLVSLDSVGHVKSNDIKFSHVGHFRCRPFWIVFQNAVFFERIIVSLRKWLQKSSAPCPLGTQKVWGQRHLVVKSYNGIS